MRPPTVRGRRRASRAEDSSLSYRRFEYPCWTTWQPPFPDCFDRRRHAARRVMPRLLGPAPEGLEVSWGFAGVFGGCRMRLEFGDCLFDSDTREILRKNKPVHLSPKAF